MSRKWTTFNNAELNNKSDDTNFLEFGTVRGGENIVQEQLQKRKRKFKHRDEQQTNDNK